VQEILNSVQLRRVFGAAQQEMAVHQVEMAGKWLEKAGTVFA
jgi:hypothetical protein